MKKILTALSALVLCLVMPLAFIGCGTKQDISRTVEVNMNPNIVFTLDANNKVSSVQFKTDETNQIFFDVQFEGKTLDQAMELFVNYSLISGHVQFNGNEVTITGTAATQDALDALHSKAKTALENAFDNVGVPANVTATSTTIADIQQNLKNLAATYAPEIPADTLAEMDIAELTALIDEKQKEYAGLAMTQIDSITAKFMSGGVEAALAEAINTAYDAFEEAEELLNEYINNKYIPNSVKQEARAALNEAKAEFEEFVADLEDRKAELIAEAKQAYAEIKAAYESQFKTSVSTVKTNLDAHLDAAVNNQTITAEQAQKIKDLAAQYMPAA